MPAMDVHQRDDLIFPQSLPEFQHLFPDDAACAAYLECARWPDSFICSHCAAITKPFRIATRPGVLERKLRRQISESEKQTIAPDASSHEQEELHRLHEEFEKVSAAREEAEELLVTFNDAAEFVEGADRAGDDDDDRAASWKSRAEETQRGIKPKRGKGYGYRRDSE